MSAVCAIDFGTSNSAIALTSAAQVQLVELEPGHFTMPTAVFYSVEGLRPSANAQQHYGRAAVTAYMEGHEGRLMRSMKSILGSTLATQSTDVGGGRTVAYLDVIASYLRHLKSLAEQRVGQSLTRVVLGRPVYFVDGDPQRDAAAQASLMSGARAVGFSDVVFQYEPIAAALDYERTIDDEQVVLVADIGGGTSDFSLVRVGPKQRQKIDRRSDILANHGVHVAGTDFDRLIDLNLILPLCGFRAFAPNGREVPSGVYFDLSTWHLINTVYGPARVAELKRMKSFYADSGHHQRLMSIVTAHLGHALMAQAEAAKIALSHGESTQIDLSLLERGLSVSLHEAQAIATITAELDRIACAATETLTQAGLRPQQVDVLYLTGGSTGFDPLVRRIAEQFGAAKVVRGDPLASVAQGLGEHARRIFG